ncbi:MAG: family 20 glycosylhydrolase [Rikenellaceae bacterium]
MKRILFLITAIGAMLTSCTTIGNVHDQSYNQGVNIIPAPKSMTFDESQRFMLTAKSTLSANDEQSRTIAQFFANNINIATGYNLSVADQDGDIELLIDESLDCKAEGYTLTINPDKITAIGKDKSGLFYAMQTLMQLLPAEISSKKYIASSEWSVPCGEVEDEPRFGYRGIMLDPCRHFMPVEFIKNQLDIFAMFKINRMHWHLTEDQGWRIEIKKYPRLTEFGSTRIEGEGFEYSGFYTQDEVKEIVAYATERQITIVPEFELPGHELAAIAAYPELSCRGEYSAEELAASPELARQQEPITPRIIWGVEDIVMCPAKSITFQFIEDVIDEMTALFPGEYFHIGGDECPKTSWKNCPHCQQLIREKGLFGKDGHTAEERLQSYVINRVEQMLTARGKKLIGWDEILEGGLSPNATVMSWRGENGGIAAAKMGHNVVMTPNAGGMYIDHYQGDYRIEPAAIGGYALLSKTYSYDPMPKELVEIGKADYVMGVQANLWTEYMYTTDLMEYRLYPRALAVSEIGWSEIENKDFDSFSKRIENAYVRLDSYGINYHIPQPEQPRGSVNHIAFTESTTVEFTTTRPIKMVYTLDGEDPTPSSQEYSEPFEFMENVTIKIRSVLPSGKMSPVREITVEKQDYAAATEVDSPQSGLKMATIEGEYLNMEAFAKATATPTESVIARINDVVDSVAAGGSLTNFNHIANVAEGYIDIPSDGVYYFWTNNNEFWIDGKLLISNDNEVKRFSRNSRSVALAKGLHPIKIVWLSHIIGGWPSCWDNGTVMIREAGEEKEKPIAAPQLFYAQ